MKTLQVIETAYRATLEEQDDTIVWLAHAMCGAGAELGVLLTGNAVSYAARDQRASGLRMGEWRQTQPPDVSADLIALAAKGVALYAVEEDLEERGILGGRMIEPLTVVSRQEVAKIYEQYPRIWHW